MSEREDVGEHERVVGNVLIQRVLQEDGDMRDIVSTDDGYGGLLDIPTAIGMMAVGQHTLLMTTFVCSCNEEDE